MARASNIYIVVQDLPIAAFTVKYECANFIKEYNIKSGYVMRLRDGGSDVYSNRTFTISEFLDGFLKRS